MGDAADDPVVLVFDDGNDAWIVGTDKQFGLRVYDLDGNELHALATGRLNNVDAVELDSERFLIAASNRTIPAIDLYEAAPGQQQIGLVARLPLDLVEPYGLCMADIGNRTFVFVGDKTGVVQQWLIADAWQGSLVNTYRFASQTEGCVVDAESKTLFVGEEARGIWAVALGNTTMKLLDSTEREYLVADVEGLDIYDDGGTKLLIASSQGDSSYVVYELPAGNPVLKFRIADNKAQGIDGTSDTDGIAVSSAALPGYPAGMLVVQDGYNVAFFRNQNFKVVDWREIAALIQNLRESP